MEILENMFFICFTACRPPSLAEQRKSFPSGGERDFHNSFINCLLMENVENAKWKNPLLASTEMRHHI